MSEKKRYTMSNQMRENIVSYLFLFPAMLFFIVFVLIPLVRGVFISFFNYTNRGNNFIGFENYANLAQDPIFLQSMWNTIVLVVVTVPLVVILSIFVAMNIYKKAAFIRSFYRTVFYLPTISAVVSVTVVWGWIYHPIYGILNYITKPIVGRDIAWLGDARFALFCIILVLITTSVGQPIVLYIASLGNVPKDYIEASELDGASPWQVFQHVIWPLLSPTTLYILVITTINSFQCFSLIQLLTSGGPYFKTSTVMYLVYERALVFGQYGYSAAMGVILALLIIVLTRLINRIFGAEVSY